MSFIFLHKNEKSHEWLGNSQITKKLKGVRVVWEEEFIVGWGSWILALGTNSEHDPAYGCGISFNVDKRGLALVFVVLGDSFAESRESVVQGETPTPYR